MKKSSEQICLLKNKLRIFVKQKETNLKIEIMNFQELNTLIEELKKDSKNNKDLINFYESKRKQILTDAFNKAFEK